MNRGDISWFIRNLRLSQPIDNFRYLLEKIRNRKDNQQFLKEHSETVLPPSYLIYESFAMNYNNYYNGGKIAANELTSNIAKHTVLEKKNILDWGCGPGRIIRHLPEILNNHCTFFGTDYNKQTINWCKENLNNIQFNLNSLEATLPYQDEQMDIIYGISIFTHLSEKNHSLWLNELLRVLKPNGILYITTQGDSHKLKLTKLERQRFEQGELIVRGKVIEGHRTYSAFQPELYMEKLFKNHRILEHIKGNSEGLDWIPQDVWIIKK